MKSFLVPGSYFELVAGYDHDMKNTNAVSIGDRQIDFMIVSPNVDPTVDKMFSKAELRKMSAEEVAQLHVDLELGYYGAYSEPNKEEMIDDLVNVTVADYYKNLYANTRWYDLPCDIISRGFCQGDAVKIVFHKCRHKDASVIDNILWGSPITIRLIDHESGDEWYIDEYLESSYNYDRDELLEACKLHLPESAYKFLEENLPSKLH